MKTSKPTPEPQGEPFDKKAVWVPVNITFNQPSPHLRNSEGRMTKDQISLIIYGVTVMIMCAMAILVGYRVFEILIK